MKEQFKLNTCAGDGVGIERSMNDGRTWTQVAYVNAGAVGATVTLAKHMVIMMNLLANYRVNRCPGIFGLELSTDCPVKADDEECRKCWDNAFDKAAGEDGE